MAHHVMDCAVTEGQVTLEGMMSKVPAPMFRVLESTKYTFELPDSKLYSEKAPPYNGESQVLPRQSDGQEEIVNVVLPGDPLPPTPEFLMTDFEKHLFLAMPMFERQAFLRNEEWTYLSVYVRSVEFSLEYRDDPIGTMRKEAERHPIWSAEWGYFCGEFPNAPDFNALHLRERLIESTRYEYPHNPKGTWLLKT